MGWEYLSYPLGIAAIILAYKIYMARKKGESWSEIRILIVWLICLVIFLWALNIYIGFFSMNGIES
jgi:hypothetical protein